MSRKKDELRWTPEGEAALAQAARGYFPVVEARGAPLAAIVATKCAVYAKRVARAVAKSKGDALTAKTAKLLAAWTPKTKPTVESAALIATALGACAEDADIAPFLAYILETRGAAFSVAVLVAMWRVASNHHESSGVSLRAAQLDTTSAHDASVSYGKGDIVQFLRDAGRRDPQLRAQLAAAVDAVYPDAPLAAKAPLACAIDDAARAAALAKELLKQTAIYPHWSWHSLPQIVTDVALAKKLYKKLELRPWIADFGRLGVRALELYAQAFDGTLDGATRERMLVELANVHGPRTARIMAAQVTNRRHAATTKSYLVKYPELLADVLADPACADDHPYLEPLVAT